MKHDDELAFVVAKLRNLRLLGMAENLPEILATASKENLPAQTVIDRLCDEE